jgi:hypothetical protein
MTVLNIAIVIIAYATIAILIYFLRQDEAVISRAKTVAFAFILGGIFTVLYPLWELSFGNSVQAVDLYILIEFSIVLLPAFIIYPKKLDKNLFFISTTTPLMVVGHGLGNISEMLYAPNQLIGRLLNLIVMSACFSFILAGLFYLTRKKFPGLYENENPKLWRRLWIITLLMGLTQIVAGNVFSDSSFTAAGIIPARIICLAGIAAILFIAGLAKLQAEEAAQAVARADAAEEAVTSKEKAYAAIVQKTEEISRLRHDRRQIIAAIGGLNETGKEEELESYCLEVLEQLGSNEKNEFKRELKITEIAV